VPDVQKCSWPIPKFGSDAGIKNFDLPCDGEVRGHCKCKEMPVIPVNRVVAKKRIIGKN
jgi:hypothetical protein